jgi:hypothetical protein
MIGRSLIALMIAFFGSIIGMLLFRQTQAWTAPITCPGAAEVIPGVDVSHPLPERTDFNPHLTCVDEDGSSKQASNFLMLTTCTAMAFVPALALTFMPGIFSRKPASTSPELNTVGIPMRTLDPKEAPKPSGDLARRLKELTEARDAGLLTEGEFETKKAEMLEAF